MASDVLHIRIPMEHVLWVSRSEVVHVDAYTLFCQYHSDVALADLDMIQRSTVMRKHQAFLTCCIKHFILWPVYALFVQQTA
jgi:hypothetical protein